MKAAHPKATLTVYSIICLNVNAHYNENMGRKLAVSSDAVSSKKGRCWSTKGKGHRHLNSRTTHRSPPVPTLVAQERDSPRVAHLRPNAAPPKESGFPTASTRDDGRQTERRRPSSHRGREDFASPSAAHAFQPTGGCPPMAFEHVWRLTAGRCATRGSATDPECRRLRAKEEGLHSFRAFG